MEETTTSIRHRGDTARISNDAFEDTSLSTGAILTPESLETSPVGSDDVYTNHFNRCSTKGKNFIHAAGTFSTENSSEDDFPSPKNRIAMGTSQVRTSLESEEILEENLDYAYPNGAYNYQKVEDESESNFLWCLVLMLTIILILGGYWLITKHAEIFSTTETEEVELVRGKGKKVTAQAPVKVTDAASTKDQDCDSCCIVGTIIGMLGAIATTVWVLSDNWSCCKEGGCCYCGSSSDTSEVVVVDGA